jgi:hypothetical protein
MEPPKPEMYVKYTLINYVFFFLQFRPRLALKLAKSANISNKNFLLQNYDIHVQDSQIADFDPEFETVEKNARPGRAKLLKSLYPFVHRLYEIACSVEAARVL